MSRGLIETAAAVFEWEVTPDGPGELRRILTVTQLSGVPLTMEQWRAIAPTVVADMMAAGNVVYAWGLVTEDPH